jgi:hypothetical protein
VNVSRTIHFKGINHKNKKERKSNSSQKTKEKTSSSTNKRMISTVRIGGLKKTNRYHSKNSKQQSVQKEGFFITSVEDHNNENLNTENNENNKQQEQEKPMFEDINRNSKLGTFNTNSKRLKKPQKLVYRDGRLTRIKNSYAQLGTSSKLPKRINAKSSMSFLQKTAANSRNSGAQTQRTTFNQHMSRTSRTSRINVKDKEDKKEMYMTQNEFKSLLEKYKTE